MSASNIQDFLKIKPIREQYAEVTIHLQGVPLTFKVKGLHIDELNTINVQNLISVPPAYPGGPETTTTDNLGALIDIAINGIIEPDLRSADLQNHFGAMGEQDLLVKMFDQNIPELSKITEKITELSNQVQEPSTKQPTTKKEVEEAKN